MSKLSKDELEELKWLRKSAAKLMTNPLERVFFELEGMLDRPPDGRIDSVMSTNCFRVLGKALVLLKQEIDRGKKWEVE